MIDSVPTIGPLIRALLPWILPPLLGALIGYLTNSLAIRMLFRPLQPIRVLGLTLPFTPGVIPRQREELAESIARMVARELLTTDVFEDRFRSEAFSRAVQRGVYRFLGTLSEAPLKVVEEFLPVTQIVEALSRRIGEIACDERTDLSPVTRAITAALSAQRSGIAGAVQERVLGIRPFGEVDGEIIGRVVDAIRPSFLNAVSALLQEPESRRQIHSLVRRVLSYTLDQLNSFQRLMVSAGQYDRQLMARVPSIVARATSEIGVLLAREESRDEVVERIERWVTQHRSTPLGEVIPAGFGTVLSEWIERFLHDEERVGEIVDSMLRQIRSDRSCRDGIDAMGAAITRLVKDNRDRPLGEIIPILRWRRATAARIVTEQFLPVLSALTPRFVAQLDVHRVVVDRINALDIRQVEGLLQGIIQRHLKWINAFGALLGGLIGAIQILLRIAGL